MKKSVILLSAVILCLLCGCAKSTKNNTAKVMADYLDTCEPGTKFGIYDINNDGNKELLTAENNSHANTVKICAVNPKTQEITEIGEFGSWGSVMVNPENACIIDGYTGQGIDETMIYKIEENKAELIVELWDNSGAVEEGYEFKVNGDTVPESQYYSVYDEYTSGKTERIGYNDFLDIEDYESNYKALKGLVE